MFSKEITTHASRLVDTLRDKGLTITTAESCTGGLLAAAITEIDGASQVFERGAVTYANAAKHDMIAVPDTLLAQHGAVSREVATAMAEGAREAAGAGIAVAITGIAGPTGGTEEKPVGLVFISVAQTNGETVARKFLFENGGRSAIRQDSVQEALNLTLQIVSQIPLRQPV